MQLDNTAESSSSNRGRQGHNGLSASSRSSSSSNDLGEEDERSTTPSTPAEDLTKSDWINPLYSLAERVENVGAEPIHVYKVTNKVVVVQQGEPVHNPLLHPLTWVEPLSPSSPISIRDKGKGRGDREADESGESETMLFTDGSPLRTTSPLSMRNDSPLTPPQTPPKPSSYRLPSTSPNSRASPKSIHSVARSSSRAASPALQQRIGLSLSKPLPRIALNELPPTTPTDTLFPPPAPLRRSTTTGSPIFSSSASFSHSPHRTSPRHHLARAQSQDFASSSTVLAPLDLIPRQSVTPLTDDVESSIARQATIIRRDRATKKIEAEKEVKRRAAVEEGPAVVAGGIGGSSMRGSSMRRRSTRAGSGSDLAALGTGVLVGNLIDQNHANYVLMYNMLTGIRIAVSRCQAKVKRPLTDEDYTARHKFSFDIVGNELTPSTKYDFKFKDYAPWIFRDLRERFCLDPSDYLVSLTAKYILSELGSPGKSGSFFYFSRDYRFIIKTIRHSEHKFLRSILKEYAEYVRNNPHTLLSRFYGLHRVKLPRGRKIHFVIMNNLFPPHRDIHETYDLKGSSIGRITPEATATPTSILKDLNWLLRHRYLSLGPAKKALFEEQLRRDTELLQKLRIMDYSLLAGIHNVDKGNVGLRDEMLTVFQPSPLPPAHRLPKPSQTSLVRQAVENSDPQALSLSTDPLPETDESERRRFLFYMDEGGVRATGEGDEDLERIYYLGIIDILTPYTCIKRLENFFRGFKYDRHLISAVPPVEYGDRFMNFIYSVIKGNDETLRPRMALDGIGKVISTSRLSPVSGIVPESASFTVEEAVEEKMSEKVEQPGKTEM